MHPRWTCAPYACEMVPTRVDRRMRERVFDGKFVYARQGWTVAYLSALVEAIGCARDASGATPAEAFSLLIELLDDNDNTANEYDDGYYLGAIIRVLAGTRCKSKGETNLIVAQVMYRVARRGGSAALAGCRPPPDRATALCASLASFLSCRCIALRHFGLCAPAYTYSITFCQESLGFELLSLNSFAPQHHSRARAPPGAADPAAPAARRAQQ
eukprot:6189850-Pleurochrysis_carterae.AAC.2